MYFFIFYYSIFFFFDLCSILLYFLDFFFISLYLLYHLSLIYRSSLYSNFLFSEMVQRINRFTKRYDGLFNVPGIAFFIPLTVNHFAIHLVYRALLLSCRTSYQKQLHRVRCCESSQYYRHH